jgi:LacI family transcriptional regulator
MPTLKDVAARAGVSIASASYVLNDTKATSSDVTRRVKDAARELGYRPNRAARALKMGSSAVLGLIVPDLQNPFFPKLVQAAERRARALGYSLSLVDVTEDPKVEREALEQFAEQGVAAVIVASLQGKIPKNLPYPLVALDGPVSNVDSVCADHHGGGRLAAEQLIALGHQRFGLLSGPQHLNSARLRREGTLAALSGKAKIVWEVEMPFGLEMSPEALERLAAGKVTAVIAGNDAIAIGAINALIDLGKRVPEDISVVGFDDIAWASLLRPRLSTVRQPILDLGARAVDIVLHRLRSPGAAVSHQILAVEWIARDSTAPPKKR